MEKKETKQKERKKVEGWYVEYDKYKGVGWSKNEREQACLTT